MEIKEVIKDDQTLYQVDFRNIEKGESVTLKKIEGLSDFDSQYGGKSYLLRFEFGGKEVGTFLSETMKGRPGYKKALWQILDEIEPGTEITVTRVNKWIKPVDRTDDNQGDKFNLWEVKVIGSEGASPSPSTSSATPEEVEAIEDLKKDSTELTQSEFCAVMDVGKERGDFLYENYYRK